MQDDNTQPITKKDLDDSQQRLRNELRKDVAGIVSELATDIMRHVSSELEEVKSTTNRIENKLDATANHVDDHEVRIKKLENQAA